MVAIKKWWNAFKTLAIIFSFVTNFILVVVLLFLVLLIFQIKNGIAEPLLTGLHSSFVGLDQARIITTINVDDTINVKDFINVNDKIIVTDTIPVRLNIPLKTNTNVTLTSDVPLRLPTTFTLSDGTALRGTVALSLPSGLQLPVALNLNVPVDEPLPITLPVPINLKVPVDLKVPVHLKVPVDIPLNQTQLHDPFFRLKNLFEPFVRGLGNLPGSWDQVPAFIGKAMSGQVNLLADTPYSKNPWPGFVTGGSGNSVPKTDSGAPPVPGEVPTNAPTDGTQGSLPPAPDTATPNTGLPAPTQDNGANNAGNNTGSNTGANPGPTNPSPTDGRDQGILPSATANGSSGSSSGASGTTTRDQGIITPTP